MTDPTTRYPLPDEPGTDPLAGSGGSVDDPPPSTPPSGDAAPTAVVDPSAAGTTPPPPPSTWGAGSGETPGWAPPVKDEGSRWPAVVFGVILIVVGLWFFAQHTLGLDLPTIRWGQLWPLLIIGIGLLILYGARRSGRK
jgi:hypothetical protein